MKKILLAVTAALAITSCSQNEEFENANQQTKIDFTSVVKKATRAVDTTTDNFLGFTVNSYVTATAYDGTTALGGDAYMNGISYTRDNTAAPWTTTDEGIYYWPSINSGKKVQFFAYPTTEPTSYSLPATGYPTISFAVDGTPASQKDLVVAHAANVNSESNEVTDGTLTLDFRHVLTRINFAFIPDDPLLTYTVTAISIADVKGGTGKYSFNADNGEWDLTAATSSSYNYTVKQSADKVENKNYYSLADTNASWMLFPQKVNGKVISITYSTKQGEMEVFSGTKTVTLPSDTEWKIGQNVLYVLTLPAGADQVGIDTKVSSWNAVDESNGTAN